VIDAALFVLGDGRHGAGSIVALRAFDRRSLYFVTYFFL
jgi:hypothetical protein